MELLITPKCTRINDFKMHKCLYFVLVMNCLCCHCQYLLLLSVFELHDLFTFLHFVGGDAFSLAHISSVFHYNPDSFSTVTSLKCVSLRFSRFLLVLDCLSCDISSADPLIPSTSWLCVFKSLHVALFISG